MLAKPLLEEKFWKTASPADVRKAVRQGARVDARGRVGSTPLHYAVGFNPKVILTLLELGADPKARTNGGQTPWDLIQENDKLKNTEAYWRLNDPRY